MIDAVKQVFAGLLLLIMAVELESQGNGAKGAEKKAAAVVKFTAMLEPSLPVWLRPVVSGALGMLIDTVVAWAERSGFFAGLGSA